MEIKQKILQFYHRCTDKRVLAYLRKEIYEWSILGWDKLENLIVENKDKVEENKKNILSFDILGYSNKILRSDGSFNFKNLKHKLKYGDLPDIDIDVSDRNKVLSTIEKALPNHRMLKSAILLDNNINVLYDLAYIYDIPKKEAGIVVRLFKKNDYSSIEDAFDKNPVIRKFFTKYDIKIDKLYSLLKLKRGIRLHGCLQPNTLILTNNGSKEISRLNSEENSIFVLNQKGKLEQVNKYSVFPTYVYGGVKIKCDKETPICSPNHRWMIYYDGKIEFADANRILWLKTIGDVFLVSEIRSKT